MKVPTLEQHNCADAVGAEVLANAATSNGSNAPSKARKKKRGKPVKKFTPSVEGVDFLCNGENDFYLGDSVQFVRGTTSVYEVMGFCGEEVRLQPEEDEGNGTEVLVHRLFLQPAGHR